MDTSKETQSVTSQTIDTLNLIDSKFQGVIHPPSLRPFEQVIPRNLLDHMERVANSSHISTSLCCVPGSYTAN